MLWLLIPLASVAILALCFIPRIQVRRLTGDPLVRFEKENEARQTIAAIIGGLAVIISIYSTNATLATTQDGQITERYIKAVEQLGAVTGDQPALEIRLGGIYALARVALDSPRDSDTVRRVLASYLRQNARKEDDSNADGQKNIQSKLNPVARVDFQAIVTIIGTVDNWRAASKADYADLAETDLRQLDFRRLNLDNANLRATSLTQINARQSSFKKALLFDANLEGSELGGADLREADLRGASLTNAHLDGAHLNGANLSSADLRGSRLAAAKFDGAIVDDLHVEGVDLSLVQGLCVEQIQRMATDAATRLPKSGHCQQR